MLGVFKMFTLAVGFYYGKRLFWEDCEKAYSCTSEELE